MRERLPDERPGFTHRFAINAKHPNKDEIVKYKGYVTVGLYSDGRVGELFVKMDKQGSQTSGWADCWAVAVSTLLQSGTSLESICRKFKGVKFEPRILPGYSYNEATIKAYPYLAGDVQRVEKGEANHGM